MKNIIRLFVLLSCTNILAQTPFIDKDLISSYEDYVEMDRELVYVHLNKSTYIKGESIGLKAYIFDKSSKELSLETKNLYCTISDENGKILKSKLVRVAYGAAVSDFPIDSLFTSGNYTIKAYTNWQRNFEEQNFYTEKIRVIDPEIENSKKTPMEKTGIDAQFLAEGGHLLANVENTIGVVIKNASGLGLPFVEVEIVDTSNTVVTTFKLNQFGIGKFTLKPKANGSYLAKYKYNGQVYTANIKDIAPKGMALQLTNLKDKVVVSLKTNEATLPELNNKIYKLVIHNGESLKETHFKFKDQYEVLQAILKEDLFSGINIFTVFDPSNIPILERQFFNYEGFTFAESQSPIVSVEKDTVQVRLPYKGLDPRLINQFSVSVLPSNTKSYKHHHNMASYILLQPYVRGYIEQAQYYFTSISAKKKYELDNLLLTQGWSSYDWDIIFNTPPDYDYDFENGITFTINTPDIITIKQLLLYPNLNHPSKFITLDTANSSYTQSGLFPVNDEKIRIGEITTTGKLVKPSLYLQFEPLRIPEIDNRTEPLRSDILNSLFQKGTSLEILEWKKIEQLDEVVITKKRAYTRIEKLQNRSLGSVEEINEDVVRKYRTLARYLRDKGFLVPLSTSNSNSDFVVYSAIRNNFQPLYVENTELSGPGFTPEYGQNAGTIPLVYLDDIMLHQNLNLLATLRLDEIDYIEVNKSGIGGGIQGGAGLIRIKTKPFYKLKADESVEAHTAYNIPLKFSVSKKFYIPSYSSTVSDFFNEYGVIAWESDLHLDENGTINLRIPSDNNVLELRLFIEGIVDNQTFISEVKTIKID